jgi:hypothetical protein
MEKNKVKDELTRILLIPDQEEMRKQLALYLATQNLKPKNDLVVNAVEKGVELVLELIGLGGISKTVRFVFHHHDKVSKVMQYVKAFYQQNKDKEGIYFVNLLGGKLMGAGDTLTDAFQSFKDGSAQIRVMASNTFGGWC